ncbi:MAG: NADH-quinone oxidoreductase subunit C [Cyclobacteriaceae bacterium]
MPDFPQLLEIVKNISPDITTDEKSSPKAVIIPAGSLIKVCTELYQNPATYFDMLSCLTGIDNGPQANTMEVAYNLYSIPFNVSLAVKVILPRENPVIDSVTSVWRTADWHEREAFDMFGIQFKGHPDLRRILLPADWQGYPLRKDYAHQEYYRNIKVEY